MKKNQQDLLQTVLQINLIPKRLNYSKITVLQNARLSYHQQKCLDQIKRRFPIFQNLMTQYQIDNQMSVEIEKSFNNQIQFSNNPKYSEQIEYFKGIYAQYTPCYQPDEEIFIMIESMKAATCNQDSYMEQVYKQYMKRGGKKTQSQLKHKIQADLIFIIKRQNESKIREKRKYKL